jgi:hypothetical protein
MQWPVRWSHEILGVIMLSTGAKSSGKGRCNLSRGCFFPGWSHLLARQPGLCNRADPRSAHSFLGPLVITRHAGRLQFDLRWSAHLGGTAACHGHVSLADIDHPDRRSREYQ